MTSPLLLYLRPFTSDGKVNVANPEKSAIWRNLMPTSANGTASTVTLEELILQSSLDLGLLIAIGRTVEVVGAGKIIARDDEWQEYFRALSLKAVCIVSVPSLHPSTIWELEWLAQNNLFARVVLVFIDLHFSGTDVLHFDSRAVQKRLRDIGWEVPEDLTSSTLLTFQTKGSLHASVHNSKHKRRHMTAQIREVISRRGEA